MVASRPPSKWHALHKVWSPNMDFCKRYWNRRVYLDSRHLSCIVGSVLLELKSRKYKWKVFLASELATGRKILTRSASGVGITHIAWQTFACRNMIINATLRTRRTIARILASFVDARQMEGALIVRRTFGSLAGNQWIASISIQAIASRPMIVLWSTNGIRSALNLLARFYAIAINARLTRRAIVIRATANYDGKNVFFSV